jgi:hypothetical protein
VCCGVLYSVYNGVLGASVLLAVVQASCVSGPLSVAYVYMFAVV